MTLFKSFSKKEISYAEWVQALLYSERNYTQVIKYPKMPGNVNATLLKFSMSFFSGKYGVHPTDFDNNFTCRFWSVYRGD